MKVSVYCETCQQEVAQSADCSYPGILVLQAHAKDPHSRNHSLSLKFDGGPAPTGEIDLWVRCLTPQCNGAEKTWKAPPFLVSGLINLFHASHEGHPLEVVVNGVKYSLVE